MVETDILPRKRDISFESKYFLGFFSPAMKKNLLFWSAILHTKDWCSFWSYDMIQGTNGIRNQGQFKKLSKLSVCCFSTLKSQKWGKMPYGCFFGFSANMMSITPYYADPTGLKILLWHCHLMCQNLVDRNRPRKKLFS